MSELNQRPDYSHYDSQPTEELQEFLCKHAMGELPQEPDIEEVHYVMEVLAKRRQQGPQVFRSNEEAYAEFRKYYMPKENEKKTRAVARTVRTLRTVAAVLAVVLVLAAGVSVSADAFDVDIWGKFATWTGDIFHFADPGESTTGTQPVEENNRELESLQDALNKYNITQPLMPTYLPEGFVSQNLSVMESPKEISICANYKRNDVELIIRIRQTIGVEPEQIEKNDNLVEVYILDGVKYFIFSNTDTLQATWVVGEFECQIIGKISIEEMKEMINSI